MKIPPASASLVIGPPARLSLTTVLVRVMLPQLSTPPPPASANGQALPHGSPEWTVALGATLLRVMTLSRIVTVAPSEKPWPGGTSIPPPSANTPVFPTTASD